MDCGDCARSVERVVAELPGVAAATVNFGAATLTVIPGAGALPELSRSVGSAVSRAGYQATPRSAVSLPTSTHLSWWRERRVWTTCFAAVAWVLAFGLGFTAVPVSFSTALYASAITVGGYAFARSGLMAARARRFDMNTLMTVSVLGAAALGEWAEGAMVVVLFSLGGTLQALTIDRTRGAIRALMDLSPAEAFVVRNGIEQTIPADSLLIGDLVRVKPGGRLPADGLILEGSSAIDQSAITGESLPVDKELGGDVFAGTVNGQGTLLIEVTRPASDSTLARIIHLVEEAQGSRAPSQQVIDRFAAVYTPAVIAGALVLATTGSLATGNPSDWVYRALVLLVIACPCALVISTPVSIVAAIGAATRRGVLVKGGAALEAAGAARVVAFDKTGTLTRGQPAVTKVVPLTGYSANEVLALAAAVEALSEHPLGRATVARALHDAVIIPEARAFESLPGRGAQATVDNLRVTVGNARLIDELGLLSLSTSNGNTAHVQHELDRLAAAGQTPLLVAASKEGAAPRLIGLLAVADKPRPGAADTLQRLRRGGVEHIVVLTGDTRSVGQVIADAVGADEVRAELLPAEKATAIQELRSRYGSVAMIGDGVNDAPALATADVGIAMGAVGTDVALETADLALMGDDLNGIGYVLSLSRRTTRIIRQNITLSLAVKAIALILGVLGFVNLWIAVLADMGTSLAVTFNGLRLGVGRQDHSTEADDDSTL